MFFTVIIFILTLLVLVVIHEFGHFIMAKKFNIKVLEFGFGIPPKAWGKKIGETILSINWLPIGGFVRLLGEDEVDKEILENHRSFAAQNVWKRIIVVVAGVTMNLVLAWVLFYIVIIAQNFQVVYPTLDPVVTVAGTQPGSPAAEAGIKIGERVLAVDGTSVGSIEEARKLIRSKEQGSLTLTLGDINGQSKRFVTVTPQEVSPGEKLIGVVFSPIPFKLYETPIEKIFSGITYTWDLTKVTFGGLGRLVGDLFYGNFEKASQSVAGPVGLASATNNILSLGIEAILPYIWFVGIISLNLAIFNLLPFPALDGGRLFFLLIEAITRKRVHAEVERTVHTVGMLILLGLALLVTLSDIRKIWF